MKHIAFAFLRFAIMGLLASLVAASAGASEQQELARPAQTRNTQTTTAKAAHKVQTIAEAVQANDALLVKYFISRGSDVNERNSSGRTPLMCGAELGNLEIVKALIVAGADINARNEFNGETALLIAVRKNPSSPERVDIVKALIDAGANVNASYDDGNSPLIIASGDGSTEIVKLLIASGANVNAQNSKGLTALIRARVKEYQDISDLLKKAGAKLDLPPDWNAPSAGNTVEFSQGKLQDLEDFVVGAIMDEQVNQRKNVPSLRSLDGAVLAHIEPEAGDRNLPLRVWTYKDAKLLPGTNEDFGKAIGKDRKQWPSYLFTISIVLLKADAADIKVSTIFNMGLSARSRGGNQALWKLVRLDGRWLVIDEKTISFSD